MKTMRHIHLYIYLPFLALLAALSACVGEELSQPKGEGRLRLEIASVTAEVSSATQTKADETTTVKTELENLPDAKDFSVKVIGATGEVAFNKPVTEVPQAGIPLETGKYTVEVYCGDNQEPITTTLPKYFTGSTTVSIIPGETATASISAKWGYSAICPVIAEDLAAHYKSYHLDVEVGQTQKSILLNTDNTFPTIYLLAGTNASIHLVGTNYTNKEVSNPLFTETNLPAAKEYTLNVTPDIPVFSFGLDTKFELIHTGDYLDGTKASLTCGDLSGVPTELISEWKATLENAAGEVVRSYTGTDFKGGEMQVENNWPYLPQGDYTLKYSYTINKEEITEDKTEAKTVHLALVPTFGVEVSANTSYSVYKSQGAAAANSKDGSGIFDIVPTVKISSAILDNEKYASLLAITYATDSGQSSTEASPTFSNLAWQKHTLTATALFDGGSASASVDCEVTGVPYSFNFYNNEAALKASDWTSVKVNYTSRKKCAIQDNGSNGYLISPKFYMPESISVVYSIQAQYYRAWLANVASRTIELRIGKTSTNESVATDYNTYICPGNNDTGVSYGTYEGTLSLSLEASYISFYHNNADISMQEDRLCLYEFTLQY